MRLCHCTKPVNVMYDGLHVEIQEYAEGLRSPKFRMINNAVYTGPFLLPLLPKGPVHEAKIFINQ